MRDEDEAPPLTPLLGALAVLTVTLFVTLVATLKAPHPAPALGFSLLGVLLEWGAVAWPGMGFSSAAPACYLAVALLPGSPVGWGALAVGVGVLLRSCTRGAARPAMRLREAVASALPVLMALLVARGARHQQAGWLAFLVLDVYLPAAFFVPARLARELSGPQESRWRRMRARTVLSWFSVGFLAPPLALLAPLGSLWLVPVLLGLQRASLAAVEAVREEDSRQLALQLELSRQSEREARDQTALVRQELVVKVEERALFDELARDFANGPGLASTLAAVVRMALRLVPGCRSVVVFLEEEGALVPAAFESPQRSRLESSRLLQAEEPIVGRAWRQQREVALDLETAGEGRLFPDEPAAVAMPMPGGVLYAGSGELSPLQVNLLRLLAAQAGEAILAARRFEALQVQVADSGKLRLEVNQLGELLEITRALAETLDTEALLDTLEERLESLIPHHSRGLVLLDRQRGVCQEAIVAAVLESGRPLLLEEAAQSKLGPLVAGERSVLAVPLEGGAGVIVLGHRERGAFTRDHQDALLVLAIQAGLALQNAGLHEQVQAALERLTESEAQLVQSSKMAAVGQLAAGVAHELNTPLGTVNLAIQSVLRSPTTPDPLKAMLERAHRAGGRAKEIVEKLLYYSRDARVGKRPVELEGLVRDTLELLGQQLRLDGIAVDLQAAPMPTVFCNENEIQQVLTNLLMNARDAILSEAGCLRKIVVRTRADGEDAVLEVLDAGPGVPEEVRGRIFDPFFTTKPVGKGTGLGLSVSQQIVGGHGGTLTYQPHEPRGSHFCMRLPLAVGEG